MPIINLIWAQAFNGVIGHNNKIPWHAPEDLKRFAKLTKGETVLMGRKTWESLPAIFRPLPGRRNIVLTRQPGLHLEGAMVLNTFARALSLLNQNDRLWVIGGAEIYQMTLPFAHQVYVTEIKEKYEGDAFSPILPENEWLETSRNTVESVTGLMMDYVQYMRCDGTVLFPQ